MQWEFIIALILAIPFILFPIAFVWYLNIGGIYTAIRDTLKKQADFRKQTKETAKAEKYLAVLTK